MKRNFSNGEILEAVDLFIYGNKYTGRGKKKIRDNYKRYTNKNIKMKEDTFEIDSIELVKPDEKKSDTPEPKLFDDSVTEKIILDAENSLKDEKIGNQYEESLILNNLQEENQPLEKILKKS